MDIVNRPPLYNHIKLIQFKASLYKVKRGYFSVIVFSLIHLLTKTFILAVNLGELVFQGDFNTEPPNLSKQFYNKTLTLVMHIH